MRGRTLADHAGIPEAIGTLVTRLNPEKPQIAAA